MIIIGIDPGLSGGIVFLFEKVKPEIYEIPVIKTGKKKEYDLKRLCEIFHSDDLKSILQVHYDFTYTYSIWAYPDVRVFVEKQQAFPKQGVVSTFRLGYGQGIFEGLLSALKIPYQLISPREWQKYWRIYGKGKETKNKAYLVASKLYRDLELKTKRGKIKDGICDALLIAEYGRILITKKGGK